MHVTSRFSHRSGFRIYYGLLAGQSHFMLGISP